MRRKLESVRDKKDLIKVAMDCMQTEIDKITNDHNDHLKKLFESHNAQISETKKKQWVNSRSSRTNYIHNLITCSVTIASKMPYTTAAGIQLIVLQLVSSSTGRLNTKRFVAVSVKI